MPHSTVCSDFAPVRGVHSFTISEDLRLRCLHTAMAYQGFENLHREPTGSLGTTDFDLYDLDANDLLFNALSSHLRHTLDFESDVVRLHRFGPTQHIRAHYDNAYPGCDTLIIRLDETSESRLYVADLPGETQPLKLRTEKAGMGYFVPEGTWHKIIAGQEMRYTLTVWGRHRSKNNQ